MILSRFAPPQVNSFAVRYPTGAGVVRGSEFGVLDFVVLQS